VKQTSIALPTTLKKKAGQARAQGISVNEFVRHAVEARTSSDRSSSKKNFGDPFWDNFGTCQGGPPDGSVNHDGYIYGGKM
jgi:hypothetical protein